MERTPEDMLRQACRANMACIAAFATFHRTMAPRPSWAPEGQYVVGDLQDGGRWFDIDVADIRLRLALSTTAGGRGVITCYRLPAFDFDQSPPTILERAQFDADEHGTLDEPGSDGHRLYLSVAVLARDFGTTLLARAVKRPRPGDSSADAH